jgi:hypothetical protein
MTPEERTKLNELYDFMQSLKESSAIPQDVDAAFRERLKDLLVIEVSTKDADSEDVTVDEAGAATYQVMNDPDGFLKVTINGTDYNIPIFL